MSSVSSHDNDNDEKKETVIITVEEFSIQGGARYSINTKDGSRLPRAGSQSTACTSTTTSKTRGYQPPLPSLCVRLHKCQSVLTLSNVLSQQELDHAVQCCLQAIQDQQIRPADSEGHVRMPTIAAAQRNDIPDASSACLHGPLSLTTSQFLEECILQRILAYIDDNLADIQTLFGEASLLDLYQQNQFEWSIREPAVNVYYPPNGHFGMHKDKKSLTILMPLTSPGGVDFTGGGTAFWSQAHPNEHRQAPSLVLAPPAGTAFLFGGQLSHKGLNIETGCRVVFVASFSRKVSQAKQKTWLVSAR